LDTDKQTYRPGQLMTLDVEGVTLFGPPAAGRRVQAKVEIEPYAFAPQDYRSFTFGNRDRTFTNVKADLEETTLDDNGRVNLTYTLPAGLRPPAALRTVAEATVLETGGRGVTAYSGAVVHPYESYIGLKPRNDGYAEPNKAFPISFVVTNTDGQPISGRSVKVTLIREYWNSIWRQGDDGRYRYVSEKADQVEAQTTATSTSGIGQFSVTPKDYGRYRLVVEDQATGASTMISFYSSGWGYAAWAMDSPDRVELELDKESYKAGEKARVLVRAPFPGKLLVTVEREQVFDHFVVQMDENTATVEVPISGSYKPNVYVSAHLIRSINGLERDESARAFGVVPLKIDSEPNRLAVELNVPDDMRPQNKLKVDFQVKGGEGKPYVTLAAVDEGITQLTAFDTPDPFGYFFGKKRLDVATYDLYGALLPEVVGTLSSPAGDVEAARRRRVNPASARRVKPVAFWSGLVETDSRGRGSVTFDVPQFNGTVKVMAVAYAGNHYGSAEEKVLVRDPIVMTPTFPRFLGSSDTATIPVSLFNGTGQDATFEVRFATDGPVKLQTAATQSVRIPDGREGQVYFEVAADRNLGKATFKLTARGGGQTTQDEVEVPVRPPVPFTTLGGGGSVEAGQQATIPFPDSFLPGTGDYELIVSSFPAVRFSGSLAYLLQYPHGCVEQTTSRVFPLLAFNVLAKMVEPELFEHNSADLYIEEGITKLERMQMPSGAFAYWPGANYSNDWSSIYASHFLVEARRAGYVVAEQVYDRMLNALSTMARDYQRTDRTSLERSAYAVYVLALAGHSERSTQLYLKNNALDQLSSYARYQLAGAFALTGDKASARDLLPQGARPPITVETRDTGDNFNSPIRSEAIMLDILAEVDPGNAQVPFLVEDLSRKAEAGRWYTTQENAFAFLALGKILRKQEPGDYTGRFSVAGGQTANFDETSQRFSSKEWAGKQATLAIEGTGTAYYYWEAVGLPQSLDVPAFDRDLMVRRRFLTEDGAPIANLSNFRQGDLIIAESTL
ncbi:MAG TPA: alpha-2-macroglobulin family protein, partial [Rhodothermales bacterium]|nr:alpha-2-macroglobulin family protein [Rhodothermales bacterium]